MNDPVNDSELIDRWRSGDNAAAGELIRRHFSMLQRFFSNKAPGHEEDLIQTTLVACVEARDAFRGDSTFRTYLFKLARMQLFAHYRKMYRTRELDFTTTSVCDLGTSPSGVLVQREESELLARALQLLPLDQQIALELTYWEDLGAPEVAEVLGIPENTVYSRVHRAKAHLREVLARVADGLDQRRRAYSLLTGEEED
jgi:RNA polymerase sigma-70 factor (ECF subfamily)